MPSRSSACSAGITRSRRRSRASRAAARRRSTVRWSTTCSAAPSFCSSAAPRQRAAGEAAYGAARAGGKGRREGARELKKPAAAAAAPAAAPPSTEVGRRRFSPTTRCPCGTARPRRVVRPRTEGVAVNLLNSRASRSPTSRCRATRRRTRRRERCCCRAAPPPPPRRPRARGAHVAAREGNLELATALLYLGVAAGGDASTRASSPQPSSTRAQVGRDGAARGGGARRLKMATCCSAPALRPRRHRCAGEHGGTPATAEDVRILRLVLAAATPAVLATRNLVGWAALHAAVNGREVAAAPSTCAPTPTRPPPTANRLTVAAAAGNLLTLEPCSPGAPTLRRSGGRDGAAAAAAASQPRAVALPRARREGGERRRARLVRNHLPCGRATAT